MADDSVGRRMPFAFLAELQRRVRFNSLYDTRLANRCAHSFVPPIHSLLLHGRNHPYVRLPQFTLKYTPELIFDVPAYGLNEFSPQIGDLMHEFSTSPPTDALSQTQNELNQVREIMVQNVEQILSRGERIELLVDKTDTLSGQAWAFRRG